MSFFKQKKNPTDDAAAKRAELSIVALEVIHDGVIIVNDTGAVSFINPAAVRMVNANSASDVIGIDYSLVVRLESKDGQVLAADDNLLLKAMQSGQALEWMASLIGFNTDKRIPVAITLSSVEETTSSSRIITLRNITKELEESSAQADFISTASHEMRTPVASIEGYLSLALNPQTATIDERAKKYLDAAHEASKHLGDLFRDLLDVTKLDDGKVKPRLEPIELYSFVKQLADYYAPQFQNAKLQYRFGGDEANNARFLQQVIYTSVDTGFMREILGNLIENAIKYTPEGGTVYVNVRGDDDRAIINVTDTGIGVSAEDLQHIFQKFYRADNSQTRIAGGTGLGLYLVKQRVESMSGKVWAESTYGRGSTFYVSLPRISADEYEKRLIAFRNQQAIEAAAERPVMQNVQLNQNNNGGNQVAQ